MESTMASTYDGERHEYSTEDSINDVITKIIKMRGIDSQNTVHWSSHVFTNAVAGSIKVNLGIHLSKLESQELSSNLISILQARKVSRLTTSFSSQQSTNISFIEPISNTSTISTEDIHVERASTLSTLVSSVRYVRKLAFTIRSPNGC